jgi:hypothetical protein
VRGNPHNAAGVKNKKLFERKARVIFCLARKLFAGRRGRHGRKKRFCFLLSLWTKGRQEIVKQFRAVCLSKIKERMNYSTLDSHYLQINSYKFE